MSARERAVVRLPQGRVALRELGSGEPLLFVHGFMVDGRLWTGVAERLATRGHRCIVPDWPFGAHQEPLQPDADLSPPGVAVLIASLLDELGLDRVTLVGNDSGGAMSQVLAARHPERVERLVLTNCDMLENFPPRQLQPLMPLAKLPGVVPALMAPLRSRRARRIAFRPFAKRPIDPELVDSWSAPYRADRAIARDARKFLLGMQKRFTLDAAERLRAFPRPVRFAWAPGDRFFPLEYARRLAAMVPDGELREIADAGTFVPLDQPQAVADAIEAFTREEAGAGSS